MFSYMLPCVFMLAHLSTNGQAKHKSSAAFRELNLGMGGSHQETVRCFLPLHWGRGLLNSKVSA